MSLADKAADWMVDKAIEPLSKRSVIVRDANRLIKYKEKAEETLEKGQKAYEKAKKIHDDETGLEAYKFVSDQVIDKISKIPIGGIYVKYYEKYIELFFESIENLDKSVVKQQLDDYLVSARNLEKIGAKYKKVLDFRFMKHIGNLSVSRKYAIGAKSYQWKLQDEGLSETKAKMVAKQLEQDIRNLIEKVDKHIVVLQEFYELYVMLDEAAQAFEPTENLGGLTVWWNHRYREHYKPNIRKLGLWGQYNQIVARRNNWSDWLGEERLDAPVIRDQDNKKTNKQTVQPEVSQFDDQYGEGKKALSDKLPEVTWVVIELEDDDGNPVADEPYELVTKTGKVIKGSLDGNGYARIEGVDPGKVEISFPNQPQGAVV